MSTKWQIHILFLAQLIVIASLDMSDPYWPLIIRASAPDFTIKQLQWWSALIYMLPFLMTIIATPIWSHFAEQIGQKKMLIRACLALLLTQFCLCFVVQPQYILLIRLLQGLFAGFTAAAQVWAVGALSPAMHSLMIGRLQAGTALGAIIGPVIGGVIATYCGYLNIFIASTIIFCIVMVLLLQLDEVTHKKSIAVESSRSWYGLSKKIIFLLILICFSQAARWMSSSFFALYVVERLVGGNMMVGALYSCVALTMFFTSFKWAGVIDSKIKEGGIKLNFALLLFSAAFSQYLFACANQFYVALMASIIWGASLSAISLIPFALIIRDVEAKHRSKVMGFGNSASKLGNLLGVGLGAFISSTTNFTTSFISIALLYFSLGCILLLFRYRSVIAQEAY